MNTLVNSVATLPITDVMLPSADWKMYAYKENKSFSEETICFQAKMKHIPSGKSFAVNNDGRGGCHSYDPTAQDFKAYREVIALWTKFVAECGPALRKTVENDPTDWVRGLYDNHEEETKEGFNYGTSDSVVNLFVEEMNNQAFFGRKRGLVVRTPESRSSFAIYSNSTPESLAGEVVGEFWNKSEKTWTAL